MAVSAITAFLPSIVSKSIFAPRRADKSLEADNTPATLLNAGIAVMQLSKLGDGVAAIAKEGKESASKLAAATRGLAGNSIFSDISKATNQITKHVSINGFIGLAALANVLAADKEDREKALYTNAGMYGGMLAFEGAHKAICGTASMNGDTIEEKEGLYRKSEYLSKKVDNLQLLCDKKAEAMEAIKDCRKINRALAKVVKNAPTIVKGLTFAGFSIGGSALGYKLCGELADAAIEQKAS